MLKTIIVLPDGTEIASGPGTVNAVKSTTITQAVNVGEELALGSAFANILEVSILTPGGGLSVAAGVDVVVYKQDDAGQRKKIGVFTLERPTRPSTHSMKLTGYDHIAKLDKELDLTALLPEDTTLPLFAAAVCQACGLDFVADSVPEGFRDFTVIQFSQAPVTGRQLLRWAAEVCGRFCRANADGDIEFGWYEQAPISISSGGDSYYFAGGLSYENYQVAAVEAVQLRLADSDAGYPWPAVPEGTNSYIITGNPLLLAMGTTDELQAVLDQIRDHLASTYSGCTPCKVSIPAHLDVQVGDKVQITDKNGVTITTYVMTRVQTGQRATLGCTGSHRRDSASAMAETSGTEQAPQGEKGVGVANIIEEYYSSDSAAVLTGGSWSTFYPGWEEGKYIWTRSRTTYTDGSVDTTSAICVSGSKGNAGEDAVNLRIDSSRGTVFKNNGVSTVLSAVIYKGSKRIADITALHEEFGTGAYLEWLWQRMGEETFGTILSTDSRIGNDGFTFTLSPEDVDTKVTFLCQLITE